MKAQSALMDQSLCPCVPYPYLLISHTQHPSLEKLLIVHASWKCSLLVREKGPLPAKPMLLLQLVDQRHISLLRVGGRDALVDELLPGTTLRFLLLHNKTFASSAIGTLQARA